MSIVPESACSQCLQVPALSSSEHACHGGNTSSEGARNTVRRADRQDGARGVGAPETPVGWQPEGKMRLSGSAQSLKVSFRTSRRPRSNASECVTCS